MKRAMKPSAPSRVVWIIGLILGIIGIIGHFVTGDFFTTYNYWFLVAGFVLLALGTTFKEI
jgi:membrane-associated PAP2 superfamily phosphatase